MINVNDYSSSATVYDNVTKPKNDASKEAKKNTVSTKSENVDNDTAVVYEKNANKSDKEIHSTNKNSNPAIIAQLKADAEQRTNQFQSLVKKIFNKQGITFSDSSEMYSILRSGKFTVPPEVSAKAQEDISEDGYWGVKQTSDRLVDFAKALSGNDPTKADTMIAAVKKGFEQATKQWGDKLPDICQKTLDATIEKLESWKNSLNKSEEVAETN